MENDIYIDPVIFKEDARLKGFTVKSLPKMFSTEGRVILQFEVFQTGYEMNFAIFDFCQAGFLHAKRWIDSQL